MDDSNFSNDQLSQIWDNIWSTAKTVGRETTKTALELFYVMMSPDTGMLDKVIIGAALGYQFLGEDMIDRDEHPLLGFLDNGITLFVAYSRVQANITPEIEADVNALLDEWFGAGGDDYGGNNGGGTAHNPYNHPIIVIEGGSSDNNDHTKKPPKFEWDDDDVIVD